MPFKASNNIPFLVLCFGLSRAGTLMERPGIRGVPGTVWTELQAALSVLRSFGMWSYVVATNISQKYVVSIFQVEVCFSLLP
jgi:hypothetical protein